MGTFFNIKEVDEKIKWWFNAITVLKQHVRTRKGFSLPASLAGSMNALKDVYSVLCSPIVTLAGVSDFLFFLNGHNAK